MVFSVRVRCQVVRNNVLFNLVPPQTTNQRNLIIDVKRCLRKYPQRLLGLVEL